MRKRVYLESRRGTRVEGPRACTECKQSRAVVWRYARSNLGEVHLCAVCKVRAFERSFGKIDALDMSVSGGAFESNRRRH
jgi:hypothetical protein